MTTAKERIRETVDIIFSLYEEHGQEDYIGEPVSQLEHMCQAAELAEMEGYDEEVILAAFFHDIGHLCLQVTGKNSMDGLGIVDHEKIGADFLRNWGFSEKIARLVESHVGAKRYLTFKYPFYYGQLSEASKRTLKFQGGPMTSEEAGIFESSPYFELYLRMRLWDEQAKKPGASLPELEWYKMMAFSHLLKQETGKKEVINKEERGV